MHLSLPFFILFSNSGAFALHCYLDSVLYMTFDSFIFIQICLSTFIAKTKKELTDPLLQCRQLFALNKLEATATCAYISLGIQ